MRTYGTLALGAIALLATGCSSLRDNFRPVLHDDVDFISDLGELRVLTADELIDANDDPASIPDALHYGRLGANENPGIFGGATFQFRGTGRGVCIVVDPEAMFWSREISTQGQSVQYKYEDIFEDDGDLDLTAGLTAYYTGSPGSEIGDFNAAYDDPSGVEHDLEFNECVQSGYQGTSPVHAGRGSVEFCDVDTSLREGIMYTAVLETFSLPIDDSILNYGTLVFDGSCGDLPWFDSNDVLNAGGSECVIPNEVEYADPNGLPDEKAWFPDLEREFCTGKGKVNTWCNDNPGQGCTGVE